MQFKNIKGYLTNLWVLANPTILYRATRGFIRALLFGQNTLKTIEIFPTMQCNLTCSMCSVEKFKKADGVELEIADYERLADQGAKEGAIALTILGGEPLMAKYLFEIIRIFKKRKFFINMVSNAILVTPEKLNELKAAGVNAICFSLDSTDEAENDRIRGIPGHYQKVMTNIKVAKELGLIVSMAPVFFPGGIEHGIKVVKLCQEMGIGASGGQAAPVGAFEGQETLKPEEHDRVRTLLKEYPRLTFDWALSYFMKMRCPAGKEKIAVSDKGDIFGCSVNPITFGNIREESLATILKRMRAFSEFKKDSPVCLSAESTHYIENYIRPLSQFENYPVSYNEHPGFEAECDELSKIK